MRLSGILPFYSDWEKVDPRQKGQPEIY